MPVIFHEESGDFHLYNDEISYIIEILPNAQLGQLYYGRRLEDRKSYAYMREEELRPLAAYIAENSSLSLQYTRQEYPSYGTTDFRYPAVTVLQENGSRITDFKYESYRIFNGKSQLEGLPAVYAEKEDEALSLEITLNDPVIGTKLVLSYTIYNNLPVIARNARFIKDRGSPVVLERAMSASIDLPDSDYEMIRLSGAWARERHIKTGKLEQGVQSVYSMRGASSAEHNPFLALKRPDATEFSGEIYGFSLVYSGSFLAQVEVDTHDTARIMLGIHPDVFEWELREGESFQTPEAVMVYSRQGFNGMSQVYHLLYRTRLARGYWRDLRRPVLLNNWESTEFDFDEEKILKIASMGQSLGVELFVLDDGWFGERNNDRAGLGDWVANRKKLPDGIEALADKIRRMGMQFGLWIEPEMVNKDSDLYREHPDWILSTPERISSPCRHQYTLDLTRSEVREYLYGKIAAIIRDAHISYIKWDMNRYMTECFSSGTENRRQGEVMHRYILGLYSLYDRLIREFPHLLFESCSSGGARFDPGMLYYAPQAWTSDDTDAIERLKIQYGSSYVYPVSCMGAHVSAVPNAQVGRITPLSTRFDVASYGAFGYELDLNRLSAAEKEEVRQQIALVKQYGELLQQGVFYRLLSPFGQSYASWMCINAERTAALVSCYRILSGANECFRVLKLKGLDEQRIYTVSFFSGGCERIGIYSGSELMYAGIGMTGLFRGKTGDFQSVTLLIEE